MTQSPTFFLSNIDSNTTPPWLTASHGAPALTSGLHKSVARCVLRALSGTRTHTLQILSLLPLPIGLLGRNKNWAPSLGLCLAHSLAFLWFFNITLVSYTGNTQFLFCRSRPPLAGIPRPATLGAPVTSQHFCAVNDHSY